MEETPTFDSAVEGLQRLLAGQGWPTHIVWRVEGDVVRDPSGEIVVRRRPRDDIAQSARAHYEAGRQQGVGVALDVLCEVDGAACATVYWTTDSTDAQYRMMPDRGLKLCVATPRRRGRAVGVLKWWLTTRRARTWNAAPRGTISGRAAPPGVEPAGPSASGSMPWCRKNEQTR